MSNTLSLRPGSRLRTGGTTYEVTEDAQVPAGAVEVKPQSTRLLKVHCPLCGYTCRITQRWIDKAGTPDCPTCKSNMVVAVKVEKATKPVKVEKSAPESTPIETVEFRTDDVPVPMEPIESTDSPLAQLLAEIA